MTAAAGGARVVRLVGRQLDVAARTGAVAVVSALAGLLLWSMLPLLLGWDASVVLSGSMSPAVRPGDVVLTQALGPVPVGPGHVVAFEDPQDPGRTVLHRVVSVGDDGALVTQGDANPTPDAATVPPADVAGIARLRVPWVGTLVHLQRSGRHLELSGAVAVLGLLGALLAAPPPRDVPAGGRHRAAVTVPG